MMSAWKLWANNHTRFVFSAGYLFVGFVIKKKKEDNEAWQRINTKPAEKDKDSVPVPQLYRSIFFTPFANR